MCVKLAVRECEPRVAGLDMLQVAKGCRGTECPATQDFFGNETTTANQKRHPECHTQPSSTSTLRRRRCTPPPAESLPEQGCNSIISAPSGPNQMPHSRRRSSVALWRRRPYNIIVFCITALAPHIQAGHGRALGRQSTICDTENLPCPTTISTTSRIPGLPSHRQPQPRHSSATAPAGPFAGGNHTTKDPKKTPGPGRASRLHSGDPARPRQQSPKRSSAEREARQAAAASSRRLSYRRRHACAARCAQTGRWPWSCLRGHRRWTWRRRGACWPTPPCAACPCRPSHPCRRPTAPCPSGQRLQRRRHDQCRLWQSENYAPVGTPAVQASPGLQSTE